MHQNKKQAVALLIVVCAPWIGNILYITRLSPLPLLDFTPFGFVIAGIALIVGVYRFDLFNIVLIARNILVESIPDAVIVLDRQGRVVDLNIAASRITRAGKTNVIGKLGSEVFPKIPDIDTCHSDLVEKHSEIVIERDALVNQIDDAEQPASTSVYYDVTINPVYTLRNRHIGHLIILRDVTPRIQIQDFLANQQQKLEELVSHRTKELTETNLQINKEIEERREVEIKLEDRVSELQALYESGQRVTATLSLEHVTKAALKAIDSTISPDMAVIYLVEGDELQLNGILHSGVKPDIDLPETTKKGACLCGRAVTTGEPLFAQHIQTNPYCTLEKCKNAGFHSFAALPLKNNSTVLGVLGIASFTERDFEKRSPFLNALTIQIALGIRNALMHAQIQEQVADMAVEVMERSRAEQTLAEHLEHLEDIIISRTDELSETNARLKQEIVKREQSVKALEQSESLHRRLVETSPDAITITDLEGRVIKTNLQAVRLHGLANTDQAVGLNAFDLLPEEYMGSLPQKLQQLMEMGSLQGIECEISRDDGTTYPVEISVSVVTDLEGQPTGYMAVYRDITERKLGQQLIQTAHNDLETRVQERTVELQALNQALRDSEKKLIEVHQLAQLGNWEWDIVSNKLTLSEESYRILGISPESFDHTYDALLSLVHPDDRERMIKETEEALYNNKRFNLEYRIVRPDDSVCAVHNQAAITRGPDGKPLKISGTTQDITTRNINEQALKRQNEELTALNLVAATISRELDLPRALSEILGIILEVSHLHSAWILLKGEEGDLSLMASQDMPEEAILVFTETFTSDINSVLQTQSASSIDLNTPGISPMGTYKNMSLVLVPIQARDAVLGIFGALCISGSFIEEENISLLTAVGNQVGMAVENTRLLNQASQIELLQELDRLRSELIANVSHELRTPLGLITLFSSNLLLEEIDLPKEKQREFILGIREEAEHLERIVDDLLNLGRIEGGKLQLNQQPTDLQQIAQRVASAMRMEFGRRRIKREFLSKPLVANLDQKRIEQVVRNLLSNAIKYSPDGSTITISGYQDAEDIGLCITDQGIGIPLYEQDLIFQRFYRIDNDITRRTRGTGLGLAISKAIIEAHNGRIWVNSAPGQGSTFCISFTALHQRTVLYRSE
jgi:PAS domain S-box-containing protein